MTVNGKDPETSFRSYKEIIISWHKTWFGLGKSKPGVIDGYTFEIDKLNKTANIIKSDATNYFMAEFAMFADEFDQTYTFNLCDVNDIQKLREMLITIFGVNSTEIRQLDSTLLL